jgi:hypothetical protein
MNEGEGRKKLIDHVDPHRRDFVRRILGGAAFVAPLIATFSIDSLTANAADEQFNANACEVEDSGYVGPNTFLAYISDPKRLTRANGIGTFVILPSFMNPTSVNAATLGFTLGVTENATITSAYISVGGRDVCTLPPHGGSITALNVHALCDFDDLLGSLAAGLASLVCVITIGSGLFTLTGPIVPASPVVIKLKP